MKQKEDCKTSFYIAIITPDGKNNYKGRRDYKRINNARKAAVKLSMIYPCVMIRLGEKFNCGVECSGPFEEYKQGQKTHEHKDYLTEAGKIAYGYI